MNAIILAAGMGTRLRPLTNDRPKCLVKVGGMPMVERQIQYLLEIGVTDITLISGYKAESLNYLKINMVLILCSTTVTTLVTISTRFTLFATDSMTLLL